MEVWFFGAAALITVIATCVHVFLGGRQFVRPLLATDLPPDLKWMAYFMWHVATVSVGATGVVFGLAATGHAGFGLFGGLCRRDRFARHGGGGEVRFGAGRFSDYLSQYIDCRAGPHRRVSHMTGATAS